MSNTEVDNTKLIQEFAQAGRTGRRNALPDILSQAHAAYGTGEITKALEKLQASETADTAAQSDQTTEQKAS